MIDRRVYDTRDADDARARPSSWLLGAGVLIAVGAGAAWWLLRAGEVARPPAGPGAPRTGGRTYVAAEHVDSESARLERAEGGKAILSLVLRDVKEGETVQARLTDAGPSDPGGPHVFLDVKAPATEVGVIPVTSAPGKAPDERALTIPLPRAADRVTVIDLRWNGGRWEGFEVAGPPPSAPK